MKDVLLVVGPLCGIWLGSYLDSKRYKKEFVLKSKRQAYQDFISALSTDFISGDEDLQTLLSDPHYVTKMKVRMGRVFGPARLASGKDLSKKIRDFSTLRSEILDMVEKHQDTSDITEKAGSLGREIEDDMKRDLGF